MSITAKLVNGSQKVVEVPDLGITVTELKKLLAPAVDIPADEQRLVLRGKVLKDDDVLSAVGMEHGNAIHVVRSKRKAATEAPPAPATTAAPSAPATTAPSNPSNATASAPTADASNPYASLFGGYNPQSAGPAGAGFNFGGLQAPPMMGVNNEQMAELARNPAMMQMAAQAMQDPEFMRMMSQYSPAMANISPEQLEMTRQVMQNPEMLRQMMSMASMFNGGGNAGAGAAAASQAGATNAGGAAPFNFGGFPAVAPVPQGNPREIYREQLQQLQDMGFPNEEANIAALQQAQGSLSFAIERLLNS